MSMFQLSRGMRWACLVGQLQFVFCGAVLEMSRVENLEEFAVIGHLWDSVETTFVRYLELYLRADLGALCGGTQIGDII